MSDSPTQSSVMNVKINMENDEIEVIDEGPAVLPQNEEYVIEEVDEMEAVELVPSGPGSMVIKVKEIVEHVCGKCDNTFKSFVTLKRHLTTCRNKPGRNKMHSKGNIEHFHIMFENVEELERKAEEMEEGNICFCCEEDFETAHAGHIRCPECPKSFKNSRSFERHGLFIHSSQADFPCDTCNARCPTKFFLELHKNAHKRGKPFACQKCGKEFTRRFHLVRHEKYTSCDVTKRKEELPCKVCGKIFYRLDNLRHHLRGHLGEDTKRREYQCLYCDMAFFGSATLNIHLRTHTGEKPFPCDLCDKAFPSNPALRKHRRTHTGEKPYKCSICTKRFAAKEVLNRHVKIHTGERPHVCQFCGKGFIQATQLKSHMFHHTGENGFKCSTCDAVFNRKNRLANHIDHEHGTTECQFICEICNKGCKTARLLNTHMKYHEQGEDHTCKVCNKILANKRCLAIHLKTHEKEDPRRCQLCDSIFAQKHSLMRHMRTKHKEALLDIIELAERKKISKHMSSNDVDQPKEEEEMHVLNEAEENKTIILNKDAVFSPNNNGESTLEIGDIVYFENSNQCQIIKTETAEDDDSIPLFMDDETLKESVAKLLILLLDESMLQSFGWPTATAEHVLIEVIKQCGHTPASYDNCSDYTTQMRENIKLLFTVVIDNTTIKTLLNNHTIDEVIHRVLKMATV